MCKFLSMNNLSGVSTLASVSTMTLLTILRCIKTIEFADEVKEKHSCSRCGCVLAVRYLVKHAYDNSR